MEQIDEKSTEAELLPVVKSLMNENPSTPEGKPKRKYKKRKKAEKGSMNEERFCTIADKDQLRKLRIIAKREGLNVKDVVGAAFEKAIRSYERKHGELQESRNDTRDLF